MAKIKQQVHKRCGGVITIGYKKEEMFVFCDKCVGCWDTGIDVRRPEDWRDILKKDSRTIEPNKDLTRN